MGAVMTGEPANHQMKIERRITVSAGTTAALLILFVFAGALTGGTADAGRLRKGCDAVRNLAEIELDSSLILNIAADRDTNTCVFYVSLPPAGGEQTAASQSAGTLQRLYASGDKNAAVASLKAEFVPEALAALLSPLDDPRFQTADAKVLEAAVAERAEVIQKCSAEVFMTQMSFQTIDDVISCGLLEAQKTFAVQASLSSLSLALLIPLAEEH